MAKRSFVLSQDKWLKIVQSNAVRTRLMAKANKIAQKARATADKEHVDTEITVSQGTRPQGRSYARVTSSNADAEHGTSWTRRSRILGRNINGTGDGAQ